MYLMADFARTKNAIDKKKRKRRNIMTALGVAATAPWIGFAPQLGHNLGSKYGDKIFNKKEIQKAKDLVAASKRKVFEDTYQELVKAGVPIEQAYDVAQEGVKNYSQIADVTIDKEIKTGKNLGIRYGTRLGFGLVGLAAAGLTGSVIYQTIKRRKEYKLRQQLRKLNKGK